SETGSQPDSLLPGDGAAGAVDTPDSTLPDIIQEPETAETPDLGTDPGSEPPPCPAGQIRCDAVSDSNTGCIDPMTSADHCGGSNDCAGDAAGAACGLGETCIDGDCTLVCDAPTLACGGAGGDPPTRSDFCGATGDCAGANVGAIYTDVAHSLRTSSACPAPRHCAPRPGPAPRSAATRCCRLCRLRAS
ncbi:MAG: hypothetical protein ACI9WU_002479, partial [Myxococcota bacterium]